MRVPLIVYGPIHIKLYTHIKSDVVLRSQTMSTNLIKSTKFLKNLHAPKPHQITSLRTIFEVSFCQLFLVSCRPGEYLSEQGVCALCAPGTHQLFAEQTYCPPCPLGSYSETGWAYCIGTCDLIVKL